MRAFPPLSLIASSFISDVMVVVEWQGKKVQLLSITNSCRIALKVVLVLFSWVFLILQTPCN